MSGRYSCRTMMASLSPHKPPGAPIEVYCDESLDRGGYDLIGGLWLTPPNAQRLRRVIRGVRDRFNHRYEFKWTKATTADLSPAYRELAQKLADQILAGRTRFNCIVLPRQLIDYDTFHEGDRELGYYKFIHLLIRKRIEAGETYVVTLDRRTTRVENRLRDLRDVLNYCGRKDYGLAYDCCREVRARPSKEDDLLQAADVLLGAVGFHYAGGHLDQGSSLAKKILADRFAKAFGKPDLAFQSPPWEARFNIWLWQPRSGEE